MIIEDLKKAQQDNMFARPCQLCSALNEMPTDEKNAVLASLDSIGIRKLAAILSINGYPVGRRSVETHKKEGHAA